MRRGVGSGDRDHNPCPNHYVVRHNVTINFSILNVEDKYIQFIFNFNFCYCKHELIE